MCGTSGRWHLNFKAAARKERQLYESRLGWQNKIVFPFVVAAWKTNSSIRKSFVDAKRRMKTIHRIRVARRCTLDAGRRNRNDGRAMKIFRAFVFLGIVPALFAAEPAQVVQRAAAPSSPSSPKPVFDTLLGGAVGLIVAMLLVFGRVAMDRRVRDVQEAERILEMPLVGDLREEALGLGFAGVMSGPLVRSSYRAGRLYAQAIEQRADTAGTR